MAELPEYDNAIAMINACKELLIKEAQQVIDTWDFDQGGCCSEIATRIALELDFSEGLSGIPFGDEGGDHEWVVVPVKTGIVVIDIPWRLYEIKVRQYEYLPTEDCKLTTNDLIVEFVDVDPDNYVTVDGIRRQSNV